ncbi:calcium-binding protein [Tistrella bauzanensis]|uniref:Calcium-binding protein n=1 Tax=Tistrella arctica TaxID=3133430 RepID=A0ABU9YDV4_9PROT
MASTLISEDGRFVIHNDGTTLTSHNLDSDTISIHDNAAFDGMEFVSVSKFGDVFFANDSILYKYDISDETISSIVDLSVTSPTLLSAQDLSVSSDGNFISIPLDLRSVEGYSGDVYIGYRDILILDIETGTTSHVPTNPYLTERTGFTDIKFIDGSDRLSIISHTLHSYDHQDSVTHYVGFIDTIGKKRYEGLLYIEIQENVDNAAFSTDSSIFVTSGQFGNKIQLYAVNLDDDNRAHYRFIIADSGPQSLEKIIDTSPDGQRLLVRHHYEPDGASSPEIRFAIIDVENGAIYRFSPDQDAVLAQDGTSMELGSGAKEVVVLPANATDAVIFEATDAVLATTGVTLTGSDDADFMVGGEGDDVLLAGQRNDVLRGGKGADVLDGGDGVDTADYAAAPSSIAVNLATGQGLRGEALGDTLTSIEVVVGSADGDWFGAGAGAHHINGGTGTDLVSFAEAPTAVIVDLATGIGSSGWADGDTFTSIESVSGSNDASTGDVLRGNGAANRLYGNDGNDELNGQAGNDQLFGGNGDDLLLGGQGVDILNGGDGNDTASFAAASASVAVDLATGRGERGEALDDILVSIENVIGTNFNDWLGANADANQFDGRAGSDLVSYAYTTGRVVLDLGAGTGTGGWAAGDVFVSIENISGSNDTTNGDSIRGSTAANRLYGNDGDDTLFGLGENDQLFGGNGADHLRGGDGNDVVTGGAGSDLLYGGRGADRFVYLSIVDSPRGMVAQGDNLEDTIADFTLGQDLIDFSAIQPSSGPHLTYLGGGAFDGTAGAVRVISTATGATILLDIDGDKGSDLRLNIDFTAPGALSASDFLL